MAARTWYLQLHITNNYCDFYRFNTYSLDPSYLHAISIHIAHTLNELTIFTFGAHNNQYICLDTKLQENHSIVQNILNILIKEDPGIKKVSKIFTSEFNETWRTAF